MVLTPEQDAKFRKELEDAKNANQKVENISEAEEQVLVAKIDKEGKLAWSIPKDYTIALYLHKHLEVILNNMYNQRLEQTFKPQEKKSIFRIFK